MSEYTGLGPLPEGERMDAYFYSFTPTGVALIDSILSAVAVAGKGSYYTEDWGEPDDYYGYYDRLGFTDVSSAVDLIQRTADRAADAVREWHRDEMASEGDDWEDEGWTDAPAVLARHAKEEPDSPPSLWANLGGGMWGHAETTKRATVLALRDVTPLYPKEGQDA